MRAPRPAPRPKSLQVVLGFLAASLLWLPAPQSLATGTSLVETVSELVSPTPTRLSRITRDIYKGATQLVRVPLEWAKPIIIRSKLNAWLDELDLPTDVHQRVRERVDSRQELDEIVPFLLSVKRNYAPSAERDGQRTFAEHIRQTFPTPSAIPGMEHSLFQFSPTPAPSNDSEPLLDSQTTKTIVILYDALYLSEAATSLDVMGTATRPIPGEALVSCRRGADAKTLEQAVVRIQDPVRELLQELREKFQIEGEAADGVDAVLRDDKKLRTLTAAAVEFLDRLVCSSYQRFAGQLSRERRLRSWLLEEFAKPDGGELWSFLEAAQHERRYAMLTVVDGLQGHLIEALATMRGPFLKRIAEEQRPDADSEEPVQQTSFLTSLSNEKFQDENYLPFFRDLFHDGGTTDPRRPLMIAQGGISSTPTISVRNIPIALTGAAVAGGEGTGLPNFHFVERTGGTHERPYYFFGNDALRLDELAAAAGMKTLPQRLPDLSSMSCAAPYDVGSDYAIDALLNLALGEKIRDFGEQRCLAEITVRADNEKRLQRLRAQVLARRNAATKKTKDWNLLAQARKDDERAIMADRLSEIAELEQRTTPELLIYYNPWPDHFAHFTGPFADGILAPSGELNRLDYWLGKLTGSYQKAGVEARTLFAMAGDHGLTPVFEFRDPEEEVFEALRREGADFRLLKISANEGEGPKMNDPFSPPSARGFDVIVASTAGGNYMLDFFVDQTSQWARQPLFRELTRLGLINGGDETIDIMTELLSRLAESLDYLVVREAPCDESGGEVRVMAQRDGQTQETRLLRRGDRIFLKQNGADLLDLHTLSPYRDWSDTDRALHAELLTRCVDSPRRSAPLSWCDEKSWTLLCGFTPRPDAVVQLAHLYDIDRAGTVNLFPKAGVAYNSIVPGRHAGESFHEKDAFVGLWGVPISRDRPARPRNVSNGSIAPSVFQYLSGASAAKVRSEEFGHPVFPELFTQSATPPAAALAAAPKQVPTKQRSFSFRYGLLLTPQAGVKVIDVWIPVPRDMPGQQIDNLAVTTTADHEFTTEPAFGNRMVHLRSLGSTDAQISAELTFDVTRKEHRGSKGEKADPRYLKPNRLVPTGGLIGELATDITKDSTNNLEKARAIYEYVTETVSYDKSGTGWGRGDALFACDVKAGNCTDFHALFIALARASDIPARFEIGFPLPAAVKTGSISGYHCWAEFFIAGRGWIPVDSSEAHKHPHLHDYYFGALDADRVAFSRGRDLELRPKQRDESLNYFIYPHVEYDGEKLTDASQLKVEFSFENR
jgi:transglutaminase-like putative cysteine protease